MESSSSGEENAAPVERFRALSMVDNHHCAPHDGGIEPRNSPQVGSLTSCYRFSQATLQAPECDNNTPWYDKVGGSVCPTVFDGQETCALGVNLVRTLTASRVACVTVSSDGKYIAIACGQSAQIFEVETGEELGVLNHSDNQKMIVLNVRFSPDGRQLATGARDKVIRIWNMETKKIDLSLGGHTAEIASIDFARDGILASGSEDEEVRLWDVNLGSHTRTLQAESRVMTVAVSDTQYVAAGCQDKNIRIWQIKTGSPVAVLEGHTDAVLSISFSADSNILSSGSLDQTIMTWNTSSLQGGNDTIDRSGRLVGALEGDRNYILSVAMTPDGKRILACCMDGGVWLWHIHMGTKQLISKHEEPAVSVAVSPQCTPQGTIVASASYNKGTIHVSSIAGFDSMDCF